MAVRYEVAPCEEAHAAAHMRLIARAYADLPAHARPTHDEAFHRRIHGQANPAGASLVAVARDGGKEVGIISAVPARFRARDGRLLVGYQPTALVVDPALRGAGLGRVGYRLIEAIAQAGVEREGSFVYAYPNERSIGLAERVGFRRVAAVPTYLYPGFRLSAGVSGVLRGRNCARWNLRQVRDPVELRDAIADNANASATGFVRDRAYFEWRFGGAAARRYTLVACEGADPRETFVVACAEHRLKGFAFTVLVDGYPGSFARHFDAAVRAAGIAARRFGPRVVYVTTNLRGLADRGAPWPTGITVPERYHPRPSNLLIYPGRERLAPEELACALAMTGDWLGF